MNSSGSGYLPILFSYEHCNGTRISVKAKQLSASREGAALWSYSAHSCRCTRGLDSNITPRNRLTLTVIALSMRSFL